MKEKLKKPQDMDEGTWRACLHKLMPKIPFYSPLKERIGDEANEHDINEWKIALKKHYE